jgi:type IV secretory pathway VirB9-like protein
MTRFCLALLSASALVPPAAASDDPALIKGANDTRIRTVDYSTRTVTRIVSTDMVPVTITYGDGEEPKLVAGLNVVIINPSAPTAADAKQGPPTPADSCAAAGWCADRHANELTLQPVKPDTGSMLVVTTEKPSGERHHYAYELSTREGAIAGKADPQAYFRVSYTYSAEDHAKAVKDWQVAHKDDLAAKEHQKVLDRLATAQFGGPRTYKWNVGKQDCPALAPERISDNGQQTVMYFPMNTPISVPNKIEPDGSESLLEWNPEKAPDSGDYLIVHSVPTHIVLRRDKLVCPLERDPAAPWPVIPSTGTATPDVVRETRK